MCYWAGGGEGDIKEVYQFDEADWILKIAWESGLIEIHKPWPTLRWKTIEMLKPKKNKILKTQELRISPLQDQFPIPKTYSLGPCLLGTKTTSEITTSISDRGTSAAIDHG